MDTEDLRERLKEHESRMGDLALFDYFTEALMPEYEQHVDRWIWANDRVMDFRPLWIQRESTAPEAAAVLSLPPLDKNYKWNYGLDKDGRVIIARQENDNDSDLILFEHFKHSIEGLHYCAYDSNTTDYMMVSECQCPDGRVMSHMVVSGHEVDSEEYDYDTAGRVKRITRERNFLTPEAESERAKKLRADLENLTQRRADANPAANVRNIAPAKSDVIVLEYEATYDDKGLTKLQLHSDGTDRIVYQRK